ncbi:zinc finger protein 600-like isoform X13 [Sitophilus oryzae]|uniref:Zinc finger protein 600-like isoform X13 n=1 Tax=Sitophilus oryzae TaxID=7048 RepID=A0A6J2XPJ9_SITOR|nr:zinc finger protein 600-like isoform X13 [Sitophilus oryzae]
MDNPGEIMRFCRLCLVKDQVNIPIFEEQGDIRQIFLKISSCLPVKVSREDKLPKKICDGCSNKLDLLYEFWNTSANAEKTLLSWLGQAGVKDVDQTITAVAQQIAKPSEPQVKEETPEDGHAAVQNTDHLGISNSAVLDDSSAKDETEEPPPKRARRTAAVKAQINLTPDSEEEDDDLDTAEPMTKIEDESDESDNDDKDPSYVDVPGTSADDQPGPSGVGKDGAEAPLWKSQSEKSYCSFCNKSFANSESLKRHLDNLKAFIFMYCKNCCSSYNVLEFQQHHNCLYFCAVCSQFVLQDFLSHKCLHKKRIQELAESSRLQCGLCKNIFFSNEALTAHEAECSKNTEVYSCKCCDQQMHDETSWIKHIEQHQTPINEYVCCSNTFKKKSMYEEHVKNTHLKHISVTSMIKLQKNQYREKHVSCRYCDEKFTNQNLAVSHERKLHGDKIDQCHICLKYFKLERIRAHKITHRTKKHYHNTPAKLCNVCGRSVKNLERHLINHQSQRNHSCSECGKSFKLSSDLKRHMIVHSNDSSLQHKCDVCDKAFKVPFNLRVHMRIHDTVKPFACMICEKTYTTKQSRDNHLKTHR